MHRVDSKRGQAPTVSVLLPVYNAEPYLREAIESVLQQTFVDYELLATDDGSGDGSLRILHEYESRDERVRVFSRDNRGLVVTLNELIDKARGRYLARMDADDICLPERFAKQVAFLESAPDHVLVGGWIEQMTARGEPIGTLKSPCLHCEIEGAHLAGHTSICHPTAMLRIGAVQRVGGYDIACADAEDLDLWLRLGEIGKLANLPEVVLRYRLHGASISATRAVSQCESIERACTNAWSRRGITGSLDAQDHWRPGTDKASRHKFALQYGWVAWSEGHRKTWRHFALQAISLRPIALASWRLFIFGLLKRPSGKSLQCG